MQGCSFDEIHIHHPEDTDRSHGMSGTKMRQAAADGDIETFHKHLGSNFTRREAEPHMARIQQGIQNGSIPLKRK
jgi:predicted nucleotidyltransferase